MAQQYRSSRSAARPFRRLVPRRFARSGRARAWGSVAARVRADAAARAVARGGGGSGAMIAAVLVVVGVIGSSSSWPPGKTKQDDGPTAPPTNHDPARDRTRERPRPPPDARAYPELP